MSELPKPGTDGDNLSNPSPAPTTLKAEGWQILPVALDPYARAAASEGTRHPDERRLLTEPLPTDPDPHTVAYARAGTPHAWMCNSDGHTFVPTTPEPYQKTENARERHLTLFCQRCGTTQEIVAVSYR